MAAKTKVARLESELERARGEANWSKAFELATQLSNRSPGFETLTKFLMGEKQLEEYSAVSKTDDQSIAKAKEDLSEVENHLKEAIKGFHLRPELKKEAQLLLAKAYFVMAEYKKTLDCLGDLGLDTLSVQNVSTRMLKIIAEAFAIKGMCLEKLPPPTATTPLKQQEHNERIVGYYEKAGDLAIVHLQEMDKGLTQAVPSSSGSYSGSWSSTSQNGIGTILETALQKSPILYISQGKLNRGIGAFRELLTAVESRSTQSMRMTLARQLAEVLLRGVCDKTYMPPENVTGRKKLGENTLEPRRYVGSSRFRPQQRDEECLLLLIIAESLASKAAVLERSPEVQETKEHSFHNACAVYDLLTIVLVKKMQYLQLSQSLERALKFSFDEFHVWYQFALSLICAEKYPRALLVLEECAKIDPKNPLVPLMSARLCLDYMHTVDEGIEHAKQAANMGVQSYAARGHVALGIGYALKGNEVKLQTTRQELQRKALAAFNKAHLIDKNDHLALFHMALQEAILRQIPEALKHVQQALQLQTDHLHSLHLLALLLSAQKRDEEALDMINAALQEYPEDFSLLFTKSKLEEVCGSVEKALSTCKRLMLLWRDMFESTTESEQRGTGLLDRLTTDRRSLAQIQLSELSDRDSGSVHESMAASRVEQALSEVASSMNSSLMPKIGLHQSWTLQAQIWVHLGELYLGMDRVAEANACVTEAASILPMSHQVAYMKGKVYVHKKQYKEAKMCFESAISISPTHIKSLIGLGKLLAGQRHYTMAEKMLKDAVSIDPTSHQAWQELGKVLEAVGQFETASECLMTAVNLESASPVVPFSVIPRTFH
ncbi:tetratricopeptide repeat protein 7B isoform X2 [Lingula anatina]|uniref:Tetratricopeptide repeat protein 7B isoform X2 n=1 Tax=Lingula anatina TaxID=7574 RepID=A0A1S3H6C0_LINAN|nr:tetratricopeptide repeat protein 7B isoform X2 [Lingula anatina]|eukprot:XP_013381532.1 tetratricopeptide repeat protein 7B isoform X2 [Lingula anatina]